MGQSQVKTHPIPTIDSCIRKIMSKKVQLEVTFSALLTNLQGTLNGKMISEPGQKTNDNEIQTHWVLLYI